MTVTPIEVTGTGPTPGDAFERGGLLGRAAASR